MGLSLQQGLSKTQNDTGLVWRLTCICLRAQNTAFTAESHLVCFLQARVLLALGDAVSAITVSALHEVAQREAESHLAVCLHSQLAPAL